MTKPMIKGKVLTEQEFEDAVMEASLGIDDALVFEEVEVEEEPTTPNFSAILEDVAQEMENETIVVQGTEEDIREAVEEGKGLGQRMGEFLSKFPQTVKVFNAKPREKQFDYARSVIEGLYLQGKHLAETIPLTDEFMELDEREETGEAKEKSLVQIIKTIAVKVITATVGFVVETVFFTLDVVLESAACLTRIASHVVIELSYTGKQITKSFKRHYLNK